MPTIRAKRGEPPSEPHLGVLTGSDGQMMAIPVGAMMYIVEDPKRADKVTPLILMKVSLTALWFACACGQKDCTRRFRFTMKAEGHHPPAYK